MEIAIEEKIAIMQAFANGSLIEWRYKNRGNNWHTCWNPIWDWHKYDYRIALAKNYRPFDTAEEFLTAQKMKGYSVFAIGGGPYYAYVNAQNEVRLISIKGDDSYLTTLEGLFETCNFEYSSHCGKPQ